ncbi:LCP family protein [Peribacillus sp. SCS-155]|uniref:LCP family glycopolymer transferase n=1 Tax=Peribacillus sedimenti TaxID=3115297 RepID=UPI0039059214
MRTEKRKKKKKRKVLKIVGIFFLLFLAAGGVYAYSVYDSLKTAVSTMQGTDHTSDKREGKIEFKEKDPFSVLILGVDERANDSGRSDTMIVMTVNPQKESVEMLSIPRDTRTEIVGNGTTEKINHAYARGGIKMSIATVENFLDIPIDYYVKMNMDGFKDIVDAVGGVTVENEATIYHNGKEYAQGTLTLNGEDALIYSRIRKGPNAGGDFGRQKRQRQVISAIINKGASLSSLTNYDEIFKALGKNVETNLSFDEMMDIQINYKTAVKNMEQYTIEGDGQYIGSLWYLIVPEEERMKTQNRIKEHLGLPAVTNSAQLH